VLICDGSHNSGGAEVLNQYIQSLNCDVHAIIGMMKNKNHEKYISYFKKIKSITTVDIPNTPNAISGKDLKEKFNIIPNAQYKESIEQAIKSIPLNKGDIVLITGSLYLASEVLKLN
jgi:dihydrofolate synthase/folylpolyglutamate synthase